MQPHLFAHGVLCTILQLKNSDRPLSFCATSKLCGSQCGTRSHLFTRTSALPFFYAFVVQSERNTCVLYYSQSYTKSASQSVIVVLLAMSGSQTPRAESGAGGVQNCSVTAAATSPEKVSAPPGLMWTRAGIIVLVAVVSWITICYCSNVYYDRDSAFHDALKCTQRVLNERVGQSWLLNGTLLGSTRIGRLVLWDADLDIGVLMPTPTDFDSASMALDTECFGYKSVVKHGAYNSALRVWRKCTPRICAEFYETTLVDGVAKTGEGESAESLLFPLEPCTISGIEAHCPKNFSYYLAQAFGQEWLTTPLTQLF